MTAPRPIKVSEARFPEATMASGKCIPGFHIGGVVGLNMDIKSFWNDVLSQNERALPR